MEYQVFNESQGRITWFSVESIAISDGYHNVILTNNAVRCKRVGIAVGYD
jgi:hypothetical protein